MRLRSGSVCISALLALSISGCRVVPGASDCFTARYDNYGEVLNCYQKAEAAKPLQYTAKAITAFPGVAKREFELHSLDWSPQSLTAPADWRHDVTLYIPDDALPGSALIVANNGISQPLPGNPAHGPTDFTEDIALAIARQTRTIVISVSNIPSQYLTYSDDDGPRREDDSVAHSWKLFLDAPTARPFMSLHLPMVASMSKAMDLAHKELKPWKVERFIATGASKRGWATWLLAIADDRVEAIAPFAIDILDMDAVLDHTFLTYGKSWPLAFSAYQREGITQRRKTENFEKLLRIEDPLRYLQGPYAERLSISKYLINASGDDFFVPDNAQFALPQLPGPTALRVAPNSSHYGIRDFSKSSLIPFINRFRESRPLPVIHTHLTVQKNASLLQVQLSEIPIKITQWTATNPKARDFRYACGVRYTPTELSLDTSNSLTIALPEPKRGWAASFIEVEFADSMVTSTPVYVLPRTYPRQQPPEMGSACKTRGDNQGTQKG